jgi:hypothetical protein
MPENSDRNQGAKAERQKRLAEALRANLKRRKVKARNRPAGRDKEPESQK